MIPTSTNNLASLDKITQKPSKTYRLDVENNRITGYCDGLEAVKQAVYLILNTERFEYLIFSWNYGVEIRKLIGKPTTLIIPELERYIKEALTQDDRINEVSNFSHEIIKSKVLTSFTVVSNVGNFISGLEANI